MVVNEENFEKFLKDVALELKKEFGHLPDGICGRITRIMREKALENFPAGALPIHGFPVGHMHEDDYYGLENKELVERASQLYSSAWDGDC